MKEEFVHTSNQIYFRVDHGLDIGDGHLYRCKALGSFLQNEGFEVFFVTRPRVGFDIKKFDSFPVLLLSALPKESYYPASYDSWLGISEESDAEECLSLLSSLKSGLWIVDHYGIGASWESFLKQKNQKIVVIDDLFRKHHADIIIDQNITANQNKYASQNTSKNCSYLMGPSFSLLRSDISKAPLYQDNPKLDSYLLFLGSAPANLFYKILNVLRNFSFRHLDILNPPEGFVQLANENVIKHCSNLPELYYRQKMVFGSCGVANIERMALAVPTISMVIVDNQVDVGNKIIELCLMNHLGDLRVLSEWEMKQKLEKFFVIKREVIMDQVKNSSTLIARDGLLKIYNSIKELQHQKF